MEFIIGFPRRSTQHASIMVVVDRLTKVTHLIPIKTINSTSEIAQVFIKEIVIFHGIPKNIVSHRDAKFTSKFWKELFTSLRTELAFSRTYHP